MDLSCVVIETERLRLEPIAPKDRVDIFRGFTRRVARYTFPQPTENIADTDNFISTSSEDMRSGEQLQFVVLLKESGEFIGCAGLHKLWTKPEPGLWLKESVWGKGYGLEIVAALKRWADRFLDYEYLYYLVDRRNTPSRRIPEKLGGVLDEEKFVIRNARGEKRSIVAYRIYR